MPQPQNEANSQRQENEHKLILLGEDDLDDEEFLKETFASVDDSFKLTIINNGKEILDYLQNLKDHELPCLILLDYNMPALNGAEILEQLKNDSRFHSVPKVIWSTSQSNIYKDKCLELGADDYVVKPSKVSDLEELIRYVLTLC